MKNDDENSIEAYLRGELSDKEILEFEMRVTKDDVFKEKYHREKMLFESLNPTKWSFATNPASDVVIEYEEIFKSEDIANLKDAIDEGAYTFERDTNSRSDMYKYIAVAVMIAVIVAVGSLFFLNTTMESLYVQNFDLDELPDLVSRSEDNSSNLVKAQQLFENKKYENVEAILSASSDFDSGYTGPKLLYLGVSQMELGKFDEAEKSFDRLINSDLLDASKGFWYKALLYLKMEDREKAVKLLKKIETERLFNHEKAGKIIKKLE